MYCPFVQERFVKQRRGPLDFWAPSHKTLLSLFKSGSDRRQQLHRLRKLLQILHRLLRRLPQVPQVLPPRKPHDLRHLRDLLLHQQLPQPPPLLLLHFLNYVYLVYEFVDGANLADGLRNPNNPSFTVLSTWLSRLQIATDLAHGLDYIHRLQFFF
ncbi:hypothetical protein ACLB2K_075567 [Fragaria x ananassa]